MILRAVILLIALDAAFTIVSAADPIEWDVATTFQNRAEIAVFEKESKPAISEARAEVSGSGSEPDSCANMLIRRSAATARAEGKLLEFATDNVNPRAIQLEAYAKANGGGYRTCTLCAGTCIGLHPHDTDGVASATTSAVTVISPGAGDGKALELVVHRTMSGKGSLYVVVEDHEGRRLGEIDKDVGKIAIRPTEHSTYVVRSTLTASASDRGTCCDSSTQASAHLRFELNRFDDTKIEVTRAKEAVAYVVGGNLETGYPQVGFVWVNGGTDLCTGTLVGTRTVLTAAHCVDGLSGVTVEFKLANSVAGTVSAEDTYSVTGIDVPTDAAKGPAYDDLIFADDLALLYLDRAVKDPSDGKHVRALTPIAIYAGSPSLSSLGAQKLLFIGYGYSEVVPGPVPTPTKSGTKRSLLMPVYAASRKTFRNKAIGQNTCRGDSGGPALLLGQPGGAMVVGVVSSGDFYCLDYANNTRMDAYMAWLSGKVK